MISKRLKAIASFINKFDNVIDIGCDHGYLCIYLAKHVGCSKLLATDINQNALNSAIKNIKKYRYDKKIYTQLSDGLDEIETKNYNTIVISGMGTSTILHILSNIEKLDYISKIVIQSNNNLYELRSAMQKQCYKIANEKVVLDNKKYYVIIEFKKEVAKYTKIELQYGPYLIKNRDNYEYFKYLKNKEEQILKLIPKKKLLLRLKEKKSIKDLNNIIKSIDNCNT